MGDRLIASRSSLALAGDAAAQHGLSPRGGADTTGTALDAWIASAHALAAPGARNGATAASGVGSVAREHSWVTGAAVASSRRLHGQLLQRELLDDGGDDDGGGGGGSSGANDGAFSAVALAAPINDFGTSALDGDEPSMASGSSSRTLSSAHATAAALARVAAARRPVAPAAAAVQLAMLCRSDGRNDADASGGPGFVGGGSTGANGHTSAQLDASFAAAGGRPFARLPDSPATVLRRRLLTFGGDGRGGSGDRGADGARISGDRDGGSPGSSDARQRRRRLSSDSSAAAATAAASGAFPYHYLYDAVQTNSVVRPQASALGSMARTGTPPLSALAAAAAVASASGGLGGLGGPLMRPLHELRALALSPLSSESEALLASPRRAKRHIGKVPYKVLDAPQLADDFYLNLLDWSCQNVLAVGLGCDVYTWNAYSAKVTKLTSMGPDNIVTSVAWSHKGNHVAVGTDKGGVQLWDVVEGKLLRTMAGHSARCCSLSWAAATLATGSRDKSVLLRDVRSPADFENKLVAHKQEVCGLRWSPDWSLLASGGNDNRLLLWPAAMLRAAGGSQTQPLMKFQQHTAAIKALAWSPHRAGLLASGGGTSDRCIRFFNTSTGVMEQAIDTGSQVCQIEWSPTSTELVSAHGYSTNCLAVWRYPLMNKVATLSGHTTRVLYMALSPDGQSIITGAGDETLRLWHVFARADDGVDKPLGTGSWLMADGAMPQSEIVAGGHPVRSLFKEGLEQAGGPTFDVR